LQETHAPPQAELQQTPSVQYPEVQSLLPVQGRPFGRVPHLPPSQLTPALQSELVVH